MGRRSQLGFFLTLCQKEADHSITAIRKWSFCKSSVWRTIFSAWILLHAFLASLLLCIILAAFRAFNWDLISWEHESNITAKNTQLFLSMISLQSSKHDSFSAFIFPHAASEHTPLPSSIPPVLVAFSFYHFISPAEVISHLNQQHTPPPPLSRHHGGFIFLPLLLLLLLRADAFDY